MLRSLLDRFSSKDTNDIPDDSPAVEYTTDDAWEDVHALEDDVMLVISSKGKVYRIVNERWVLDDSIKDVRINL